MKKLKYIFFLVVILSSTKFVLAQEINNDPFIVKLSHRHNVATTEELLVLFGGDRELLKNKLLEARLNQTHPYLWARALKILLKEFSSDPQVVKFIEEDIADSSKLGIARLVGVNIDEIPSATTRALFAKDLIKKSLVEPKLKDVIDSFALSRHQDLREIKSYK